MVMGGTKVQLEKEDGGTVFFKDDVEIVQCNEVRFPLSTSF